jgi:cytoskeletal protein CcmA (bactofilin family)
MPLFTRHGSNKPQAITGYSLVDQHLAVRGDLDTAGTVRVDGRVEGHFHRTAVLIVGTSGVVAGDVQAGEVVVAGHIEGSVIASSRVEIHATGVVHGDIVCAAMMLQEGGMIEGHVRVRQESELAPGEDGGGSNTSTQATVEAGFTGSLPRRAAVG